VTGSAAEAGAASEYRPLLFSIAYGMTGSPRRTPHAAPPTPHPHAAPPTPHPPRRTPHAAPPTPHPPPATLLSQ